MLRIGFAKRAITPPIGTPLGGYAARTEAAGAVHAELYCRCMAGQDENGDFVLVSLDLLGIDESLRLRMLEGVRANGMNLSAGRFSVWATHTHSGPEGFPDHLHRGIWMSESRPPNERLRELTVRTTVAAILEAKSEQVPATLQWYRARCPAIASNRRNREAPHQPDVHLLEASDATGKVIGGMLHFACHPTVIGPYHFISSDFAGAAIESLEQANRSGAVFLFANGAAGDVSTRWARRGDQPDEAERIGLALAESLLIKRAIQPPSQLLPGIETSYASEHLMHSFTDRQDGQRLDGIFQTVYLNGVMLKLVPGELFASYAMSSSGTVIIGYANGYLGYMPDEASLAEGGYEIEACRLDASALHWIAHWLNRS
ncbi:neutral/alkaline non-lysosomal ceramidase N-terminal domain-containing protein [Paenibacillus silvisoli]|uniref:neutral/alkaline non-lysosomal ceramidase N-terminal domain-containing protein n=1 Tax=Paenibacillus silvisoli TaxID=3110539 RepID=UPI0028062E00|nr:neutral/alkaline non-lysosomal ceramidase N-terminal domain-containing protein [Paenibacillus silvisoli]